MRRESSVGMRHYGMAFHGFTYEEEAPGADPDDLDRTRRITDPVEVRGLIEEWAGWTRKEVLSIAPYGRFPEGYLPYVRPLALVCLRRGVRFRLIILTEALEDPGTAAYLREIMREGAQIRLVPEARERMLMSDRQAVGVPLNGDAIDKGVLFTREPGIIAGLAGLFELTWSQARPFPEARCASGLSGTDRQVLAAMCSGVIDEAAARDIGISVRTYRRRVADLLRQLGATSRPQAALLARDRGWI